MVCSIIIELRSFISRLTSSLQLLSICCDNKKNPSARLDKFYFWIQIDGNELMVARLSTVIIVIWKGAHTVNATLNVSISIHSSNCGSFFLSQCSWTCSFVNGIVSSISIQWKMKWTWCSRKGKLVQMIWTLTIARTTHAGDSNLFSISFAETNWII